MKIITWNCNMAFRNKMQYILPHKPDVLIVPECEHPGKFNFTPDTPIHPCLWDRKHRSSNHSNVVEKLEGLGIVSSYHFHKKQLQGREEHPTLYMYRKKDKGYHIDYCFMSAILAQKIKSVEIGYFKYWTQFSDHTPLIVTLS